MSARCHRAKEALSRPLNIPLGPQPEITMLPMNSFRRRKTRTVIRRRNLANPPPHLLLNPDHCRYQNLQRHQPTCHNCHLIHTAITQIHQSLCHMPRMPLIGMDLGVATIRRGECLLNTHILNIASTFLTSICIPNVQLRLARPAKHRTVILQEIHMSVLALTTNPTQPPTIIIPMDTPRELIKDNPRQTLVFPEEQLGIHP